MEMLRPVGAAKAMALAELARVAHTATVGIFVVSVDIFFAITFVLFLDSCPINRVFATDCIPVDGDCRYFYPYLFILPQIFGGVKVFLQKNEFFGVAHYIKKKLTEGIKRLAPR
jgi:hypothetical protein